MLRLLLLLSALCAVPLAAADVYPPTPGVRFVTFFTSASGQWTTVAVANASHAANASYPALAGIGNPTTAQTANPVTGEYVITTENDAGTGYGVQALKLSGHSLKAAPQCVVPVSRVWCLAAQPDGGLAALVSNGFGQPDQLLALNPTTCATKPLLNLTLPAVPVTRQCAFASNDELVFIGVASGGVTQHVRVAVPTGALTVTTLPKAAYPTQPFFDSVRFDHATNTSYLIVLSESYATTVWRVPMDPRANPPVAFPQGSINAVGASCTVDSRPYAPGAPTPTFVCPLSSTTFFFTLPAKPNGDNTNWDSGTAVGFSPSGLNGGYAYDAHATLPQV